MDEPTVPAKNGYSVKDVVTRVEGKMDAFIATHSSQHSELLAIVQQIQIAQAVHNADDHPATVKDLAEKQQREDGRRDMLRVIFGTSIVGLLTGVGSLLVVVAKLSGGTP